MITIKTPEQIEAMKVSGALSKAALRRAGFMIRPGVSTLEIDRAVEAFIRLHGGTPTFKGYGGFLDLFALLLTSRLFTVFHQLTSFCKMAIF